MRYDVHFLTPQMTLEVEASSAAEAKKKAMNSADSDYFLDIFGDGPLAIVVEELDEEEVE